MNRRLFALLVLIGALAFPVLIYMYFFVYYTGSLLIHANTENYSVSMFAKSTTQKTLFECDESDCLLAELSPFEYNVSFSKEGYKDITLPLEVLAREQVEIDIVFEKQPYLEVVDAAQQEETSQQKIKRLRDQSNYDAILSSSGSYDLGIIAKDTGLLTLTLLGDERDFTMGDFRADVGSVVFMPVYGTESDFFLNVAGEKYIYALSQQQLYKVALAPLVEYVHKGKNVGEFIVVTELGAYTFNSRNTELEYQYLFKKYIPYGESVIGIIESDDEERRENFNITQSGNLVVIYNQKTKERKILYSSSEVIDKIYGDEESVFLEIGNQIYQLENF